MSSFFCCFRSLLLEFPSLVCPLFPGLVRREIRLAKRGVPWEKSKPKAPIAFGRPGLRESLSLDGWLSLVKGAPLEMGQCSSHSRVQIPVRPVCLVEASLSSWNSIRRKGAEGKDGGKTPTHTRKRN